MAAAMTLPSPPLRSSSTPLRHRPSPVPIRPWIRTRTGTRPRAGGARFPRMVFDGAPAGIPRISAKNYRRLDSCLLVPPPPGRKPHAIVKFLGGAFIGATPEVTYGHLMELLAKEGFLIVSVPYNVTFDHEGATREVFEKFRSCMDVLMSSGLPDTNLSASDLSSLPLYSVGHSNGALLQLLVGSYYLERIPEANAIVSFNNKPASEAVPYFEQLGPMVSQMMPIVEANPMYSLARNASGDVWKALLDTAETLVQDSEREALASLNKFVDQLPSVMNKVTQAHQSSNQHPLRTANSSRSHTVSPIHYW